MEKERRINIIVFGIFGVLLIAGLLFFSVHVYETDKFNARRRIVGEGERAECTVQLYPRGGLADSWDKRDIEFMGEIVTFTGSTYDCTVMNFSDAELTEWKLRINIKKECYINNSWCGTVEIHQHRKTYPEEIVQELDLRNYSESEIMLEHFYVAEDLYISLSDGDYIIYNPSEVSGELPVRAFGNEAGKTTIGFIFYHKKGERLDFSCSMFYRLTRSCLQGTRPKLLLAAFALWLVLLVIRVTFVLTFSNLKRDTNSVIRAVSGIYTILYKANLENDTFQEIRASDVLHEFFGKHTSIREALDGIPEEFYIPENMREVREFFDIDTMKERLRDTDNCSADFKSRDLYGPGTGRWFRSSLIVCKRNGRNEPVEVICGTRDVDSEVREHEEHKMMLERFATELSDEVAKQTVHVLEIQRRIVSSLGDMIGSRDGNTGGHVKRTSEVMKILVDEIIRRNRAGTGNPKFSRISKKKGEDIIRAAPMHDLGKIFIDTKILCKPGKLDADEYAIMKTHAEHSGEIVNLVLRDVEEESFVDTAFNIARYHHERWDGLGYPEGKDGGMVGEGIPVEARIMSVADVYDALVSKRCYKEPMSFEMACRIMIDGMGKQFDPDLENIFVACLKKLEKYYSENAD